MNRVTNIVNINNIFTKYSDEYKEHNSIYIYIKYRIQIEIEYLLTFNKYKILNISENNHKIISNILNDFNINESINSIDFFNKIEFSSITNYIKNKLPIEINKYISIGIKNHIDYITHIFILNRINKNLVKKILYIFQTNFNKVINCLNVSIYNGCQNINNIMDTLQKNIIFYKKKIDTFEFSYFFKFNNYYLHFFKLLNPDINIDLLPKTFLNNLGLKFDDSCNILEYIDIIINLIINIINFLDNIDYLTKTGYIKKNILINIASYNLRDVYYRLINIKYNLNDINSMIILEDIITLFLISLELINDNIENIILNFTPNYFNNDKFEFIISILNFYNIEYSIKEFDQITEENINLLLSNLDIDFNIKNIFNCILNDNKHIKYTKVISNNFINITDLDILDKQKSRMGVWNDFWKSRIGKESKKCDIMTLCSSYFLSSNIIFIEDWGCGNCTFKKYMKNKDIKYSGIDGSNSSLQDKIIDLVYYKSDCESIFMKHVLEHNEKWEQILNNLLKSFTKKAIIVIHTPFSDNTKIIGSSISSKNSYGYSITINTYSFSKKDIQNIIESYNINYTIRTIETNNKYKIDNIIYLEK